MSQRRQHVSTTWEHGVATVTIDRAPVNAMAFSVYDELRQTFHELAEREDLGAVVLTGAGDRAFVGGHDVNEFVSLDFEGATDRLAHVRITFNSVYDCPVPVIAAINGPAIGTGLALASVCDIRLASDRARFAMPEINVGVLGGSKHLMRLAPQGMTRLMYYTGRRIDAHEALRLGIVDEVHPHETVREAATALAQEIAAKSPAAIRMAKQGLNRVENMALKEAYEYECTLTAAVRRTPEAAEGARAFLEGREPDYSSMTVDPVRPPTAEDPDGSS